MSTMNLRHRFVQFSARVLRPLRTDCWVCNMTRGIALGLMAGAGLAYLVWGL